MSRVLNSLVRFFAVPIGLMGIILVVYYLGVFNKLLFPNPLCVWGSFFAVLLTPDFYFDFFVTFLRVVVAIFFSIFIGIPIGLFLGYYKWVYDNFEFLIDFLKSLPVAALFPMFILFFGIGDMSKIVSGAWLTSLIIIVNTSYGVRHARRSYVDVARVYSVGWSYKFTQIIFFQALPNIFSGIRVGVSISLILVIIFEMFVGSNFGIGYSIMEAQFAYRIPEMYALILMTGFLGYFLNKILVNVEKRVVHWT